LRRGLREEEITRDKKTSPPDAKRLKKNLKIPW